MEHLAGALEVLNQKEITEIHAGALQILSETGMEVPISDLLGLLSDAGLKVALDKQRVYFPPETVEKAIETSPSHHRWHARNPRFNLTIGGSNVTYGMSSNISTVMEYDGRRRPATIADTLNISRLSNALPAIDDAYCAVWPNDAPKGCEHTYILYAQFSQGEKPVRARLHGSNQAKDSIAMARIVAGGKEALKAKPMLMAFYSPLSPLASTREQLEGALHFIENNQLLIVCPGLYGGAMAPITLAGILTQQTAEFLGMLTIAQILNPGAPVAYGTLGSVLDLRTGAGPIATPEACLIQSAVAQLGRFYQVPSRGHAGTDAHGVDAQTGFESGAQIITGALAGLNVISHCGGFIDGGRAFSYESLLVEHEIVAFARRIVQGIKVTPDTLAVELIQKVGPKGTFITEAHTSEYMRAEVFVPELSNREGYDAWLSAGEKSIADKAHEKIKALLASVTPTPLDPVIDRELKDYMQAVERRQS